MARLAVEGSRIPAKFGGHRATVPASLPKHMANPTFAELVAAPVSRSHPLAIIEQDWIAIRDSAQRSYTVISLLQLSGMKRVTTSYPALIVISCGIFLTAAAAFCSKEGSGAGIPLALLGACFAIGYFLTRRAALVIVAGSAHFETASGSLSEVAALAASIQLARDELSQEV